MQDESLATRRLANFVFDLAGGKGNFNDHWPLDGKERTTIAPPTKEWWDKMKKAQLPVDKNIDKQREDARLKHKNRS